MFSQIFHHKNRQKKTFSLKPSRTRSWISKLTLPILSQPPPLYLKLACLVLRESELSEVLIFWAKINKYKLMQNLHVLLRHEFYMCINSSQILRFPNYYYYCKKIDAANCSRILRLSILGHYFSIQPRPGTRPSRIYIIFYTLVALTDMTLRKIWIFFAIGLTVFEKLGQENSKNSTKLVTLSNFRHP